METGAGRNFDLFGDAQLLAGDGASVETEAEGVVGVLIGSRFVSFDLPARWPASATQLVTRSTRAVRGLKTLVYRERLASHARPVRTRPTPPRAAGALAAPTGARARRTVRVAASFVR